MSWGYLARTSYILYNNLFLLTHCLGKGSDFSWSAFDYNDGNLLSPPNMLLHKLLEGNPECTDETLIKFLGEIKFIFFHSLAQKKSLYINSANIIRKRWLPPLLYLLLEFCSSPSCIRLCLIFDLL